MEGIRYFVLSGRYPGDPEHLIKAQSKQEAEEKANEILGCTDPDDEWPEGYSLSEVDREHARLFFKE